MRALLIVDVQKDFCPGGALAVPRGDEVVAPLNRLIAHASLRGWPILASRDWHPAQMTTHFQKWPRHCVQGSEGARFHEGLDVEGALVISKGVNLDGDSYSVFSEGSVIESTSGRRDQALLKGLRERSIDSLCVGGLATDYCVRATILDAMERGFEASLVLDASRAINSDRGDEMAAIVEVRDAGAELTTVKALTES